MVKMPLDSDNEINSHLVTDAVDPGKVINKKNKSRTFGDAEPCGVTVRLCHMRRGQGKGERE